MKTLAMAAAIDHIVNILRDHEYNARCAIHDAWIANKITADQDSTICEGISGLFDDVVEMVQRCETPEEIESVMHKFETIAQAWIKRTGIPCNF
jgi:hypothetical protein